MIRSFYKCDVVSAHSNAFKRAVCKASIQCKYSFSRQVPHPVNANCIELPDIEACRLLLSAKKRSG